jgi:hypothetical protein
VHAEEYRLNLPGELLDLDIGPDGTWVGLIGSTSEGQLIVFADGATASVPRSFEFPVARAAGDGRVLLAEARVDRDDEPNGYLVNRSGDVEQVFTFGDGIQDVLVSSDEVVVTYFDEGVFGSGMGSSPAGEGVAVFDFGGELKLGYNTSKFSGEVFIADCYCAVWAKGRRLFFCPYTGGGPDFPLIAIDLRTMSHEQWETPELVHGSGALTVGTPHTGREVVFFYGPYDDRTGVFRWRVGDSTPDRIAAHPGPLRGLRGGRFLATGTAGYTVLLPHAAG